MTHGNRTTKTTPKATSIEFGLITEVQRLPHSVKSHDLYYDRLYYTAETHLLNNRRFVMSKVAE